MELTYQVPTDSAALIKADDLALLTTIAGEMAKAKDSAANVIIHDGASHEAATQSLSVLRKTRKKLEARRAELSKPLNEQKRLIALPFKRLEEMALPIEDLLVPKLVAYQDELESKRRAEIEIERQAEIQRLEKQQAEELKRAALAEQEAARAAAEAAPPVDAVSSDEAIEVEAPGADPVDLHLPDAIATEERIAEVKAAEVPRSVASTGMRAMSGSASRVKNWDYKVESLGDVPLQYLAAVDDDGHLISGHKAVKAAIVGKDGLRSIPGLSIFSKRTIAIR